MPVSAAAIHLPLHRLVGKQVEAAGLGAREGEVRVPWWDEDALTLAVEAGLKLGDAVERATTVHIALDQQHPRPELATLALGVRPHPFLRAGTRAGEDALAAARDGPALVLAARGGPGGWGVALLVEGGPAPGIDPLAVARATPGVRGIHGPSVDATAESWRKLSEASFEPWADASQGAYVSEEEYDADPATRYGARPLGAGTVEAVTTIVSGPPGEFLRQHEAAGPYDVAIVKVRSGARVIGQVTGPPGRLRIGDAAEPILRKLFSLEGRWRYAVKWKPGPLRAP